MSLGRSRAAVTRSVTTFEPEEVVPERKTGARPGAPTPPIVLEESQRSSRTIIRIGGTGLAETFELWDDLFFRLNVVTIALPPLRERPEDIAALTDYFLARLVARHGRGPLHVSPDVRRLLAGHRWDGNVRELVSVLERAVILATGDTIGPECLPERLLGRGRRRPASASPSELSLEELERQRIEQVLAESETLGEAATRLQ